MIVLDDGGASLLKACFGPRRNHPHGVRGTHPRLDKTGHMTEPSATTEIGPVDYAVIAFPGSRFNGEIAPALAELVETGTIRIIDVAFVQKDDNGDIFGFELDEFDEEIRTGFERARIAGETLLNDQDIIAAGEELGARLVRRGDRLGEPWAVKIASAVRNAHGELFDFGGSARHRPGRPRIRVSEQEPVA